MPYSFIRGAKSETDQSYRRTCRIDRCERNVATSQTPSAPATATVTFTNSSASITGTNTFVAGQLVYFTTAGQLPYPLQDVYQGFPGGPVIYYVSATGLSGSAFQVSGSYGGTPIVMNTTCRCRHLRTPWILAGSGWYSDRQLWRQRGTQRIFGRRGRCGIPGSAARCSLTTTDSDSYGNDYRNIANRPSPDRKSCDIHRIRGYLRGSII